MIKFINIWDDKQNVFVKTKEGVQEIKDYPWYFCILKTDATKNKERLTEFFNSKIVKAYDADGEYIKVYCPYVNRENVIRYFKQLGITTFEDDLKPFQRYLVDEDVELELDQKVLYFDIETSDLRKGIKPGEEMILSIAAIGSDGKEYFLTHNDDTTSQGEISMLKKFLRLLDKYDIIAGWNSEGFDLVAITKRCKMYKLEIGCWVNKRTAQDLGGLDNVRRMGDERARPTTFNAVDLMQKMKEMHYRDTELIKKVRSFSLSAVSKVILGDDKVDLEGRSIYSLWKEDPELLKKYNMHDVELLVKLDAKLNIIKQKLIEHQVCSARLNDYTSHGKIDTFALRGARKLGKRLPSKPDHEEELPEIQMDEDTEGGRRGRGESDYEGGFVFEPSTGLHDNVSVFDFASLYPSIIKTFNISIDSLTTEEPAISLPTGVKFKKNEKGIIPSIIQDVLDQRDHIRHKIMKTVKKDSPEYWNWHYRQYAFKVLANSMYGIMGARFSRYFKRELAEGTTLTGQYLIKLMWKWMEDQGHVPIYGDSDSLFVKLKPGSDEEEVSKASDEFLKNDIQKFNINESSLHFSFEKTYKKFISVAKKKYVGLSDDGDMKMMGLEAKKRDTLPKAEELQRSVIDSLLTEDRDAAYYLNKMSELKKIVYNKELELKDIMFQKRLSREIEDYGKVNKTGRNSPIPPHVKVAAWIKEKKQSGGKINLYSQGNYIPYIIIGSRKGIEAIHPDEYKNNYDVEYYWDACYAPTRRILEVVFPQYDWYELIRKTDQLKLF